MTHRNANAKNHSSKSFQFTRPRGARLNDVQAFYELHKVSTHAPAWGATKGYQSSNGFVFVSIHAPAWGATRAENLPKIRDWFQFTRPRGARRIPTSVSSMVGCFNSRARVGRDQAMPRQASRAECFNSRARVGRDIIVVDGIIFPVVSIHAPAWGATALSGPNGNQWITYAFPRSY